MISLSSVVNIVSNSAGGSVDLAITCTIQRALITCGKIHSGKSTRTRTQNHGKISELDWNLHRRCWIKLGSTTAGGVSCSDHLKIRGLLSGGASLRLRGYKVVVDMIRTTRYLSSKVR